MQRETTRDRLKRNQIASGQKSDDEDAGQHIMQPTQQDKHQSPSPNEPLQVIGWRPTNPNNFEYRS